MSVFAAHHGPSRRAFALAGMSAIAALGTQARAAQFEFKCASGYAADHPASIRLGQLLAAVQRESDGRIAMQFFPNASLGTDQAVFSQLRLGAVQMMLVAHGVLSSVVPSANVAYLGFAYNDPSEAIRVMQGPFGEYMRQESASKGLYAFKTIWDNGMAQIGIGKESHPIREPDDLKGFKVRVVPSRISVDLFKVFGAIPTSLSYNEVYTSMQTKVVDGEVSPLGSILAGKLYEVQKYISLTNHSWSGESLLANGAAWKSLPPDLQAIVERNTAKFATLEQQDIKTLNNQAQAQLTKLGITFNTVNPAPFRTQLRPYFSFWASEFGPTAWGLVETSLGRKLT